MLDLPPPEPGIEINLSSRGVSKGLVQTEGPQLLVRPEIAVGPVFLSAYAKNISSPQLDGEAGTTVGIRPHLAGFDLTASAAYKVAIAPTGGIDDEALEMAALVTRRQGPITLRLGLIWSPDDLGATGTSGWWEAGAIYRVHRRITLGANFGRRQRGGGSDYGGFNAGATFSIAEGVTADLRWFDTNRSQLGEAFQGRLIGSLRARF